MRKTLFLITIVFLAIVSCKKETIVNPEPSGEDYQPWWCCGCADEPQPIVPDEVSDFSWTKYNSVYNACAYLERFVKSDYFPDNNNPVYEHTGDTLMVCGWMYNSINTILPGCLPCISDNERYASGREPYPPDYDFGDGIVLEEMTVLSSNRKWRDSVQYKCYLTGIVKYVKHTRRDFPCVWLRVRLDVIDIHFDANERKHY